MQNVFFIVDLYKGMEGVREMDAQPQQLPFPNHISKIPLPLPRLPPPSLNDGLPHSRHRHLFSPLLTFSPAPATTFPLPLRRSTSRYGSDAGSDLAHPRSCFRLRTSRARRRVAPQALVLSKPQEDEHNLDEVAAGSHGREEGVIVRSASLPRHEVPLRLQSHHLVVLLPPHDVLCIDLKVTQDGDKLGMERNRRGG